MSAEAEPTEQLPPPSPEFVMMRVFICAVLRVTTPKKGEAILREMAEMLASEESLADVMPIRRSSQMAAVGRARREAVAIFRTYLPVFLGHLRR